MTQTVTHAHAGGSVGGPGDNEAECTCGVAFGGFDTPREASDQLAAHIADEAAKADPWAVLAAELTAIATDLAALTGSGLPVPGYFELNVQPGANLDDETKVRCIDALAQMLLGRDGVPTPMSNGQTFYQARATRGLISVDLYNSVTAAWAERHRYLTEMHELREQVRRADAEATRLRAELNMRDDERKPPLTHSLGLDYSRGDTEVEPAIAKPDTYGLALGHHGHAKSKPTTVACSELPSCGDGEHSASCEVTLAKAGS
jgi:hypothetical protein